MNASRRTLERDGGWNAKPGKTGMRTIRRRTLFRTGFGTGLAGLAQAALLQVAAAQTAAEPIPVGALYPFSGSQALLGDESFRGLDLATDERNAAGGLLGRPIRLIRGDAVDPGQATSELRRLITAEHVTAIFGTAAAPMSSAATQISELAGVPYFELGATADSITDRGFKYLFRSCPPASSFGVVSVDAITDVLAPLWGVVAASLKIAILQPEPQSAGTVAAVQQQRCRDKGLNVVETLTYTAGTGDPAAMVQRLRAAGTDLLLHSGGSNDIAQIYAAMRSTGWRPRMVIGTGAAYSLADTLQGAGAGFDGTMNVDVTPYRVNPAVAQGAAAVAAAYQKKYGAPPRSGHSLTNYVGATLFYDAVAQARATDKDKIRAAVLAIDIPAGGTAAGWGAKFDDRGQNIRARPFLLQWQKGVLVTVFPEDAAAAPPSGVLGG